MNRTRLAIGAFALGAVSIIAIMGQTMPDIGIHMGNSRDRVYVDTGCPLKWDSSQNLFKCADSGVLRESFSVTLSAGTNTTVTDGDVLESSHILCGCMIGSSAAAACNNRGRWIARINVSDVYSGGFVLEHGNAMGNERITCAIL